MALKPVSVSQLNEYISRILQTDPLLGNISVVGEISNLKYHSSGHIYFSMVDGTSKINCFLPASYAQNLKCTLADGMEITVKGYINVYKKGGTYTLFIRSVEVSGDGNLAIAFQALKEKLEAEGLFDAAHKQPIPAFPHKIGIVTSETGAAVRDIVKIIKSRTGLVDIMIFPTLVQGEGAAGDIAAMLDRINAEFDDIDTLIVGRGGGSLEDLWAFNEEAVARAIYRSRIPVISAVGHEIDFTIADFVADRRAETPTAAAEMAVPDMREVASKLDLHRQHLLAQLENKVNYARLRLEAAERMVSGGVKEKLTLYRHQLAQNLMRLQENDPRRVLEKGYAMLEDASGRVISSTGYLAENERYRLFLQDGTVTFTMTALQREANESKEA